MARVGHCEYDQRLEERLMLLLLFPDVMADGR